MHEIARFDFPATGEPVRTVLIDGEPWFVALDVSQILGYRMSSDMTRRLDKEDRGTRSVRTPGGPQDVTVISEAGLYVAILGSQVPGAKTFKRWVTHEVLPTIRRTGSYGAPRFEVPRTLPEALRAYAAEVEAHDETRAALEVAAPAADAWQVLASADADYSVREAAFILNRDPAIDTGQRRLFDEIRRMGLVDSRDIPYASHARHVRLRARSYTNPATGEEMPARSQVRVTADGLAYLHRKLGGSQPLQLDAAGGA